LVPGTWSAILILPLIIAVIANVWIVRKMGEWYLSEAASSLPDEFYDEP
jgi:ACR3 family arsenite efflux pump ArsB